MQISSRFTVAVHIFSCMGHFGRVRRVTSDFLASSIGINPVVVRKILSMLHAAGLIDAAGSPECSGRWRRNSRNPPCRTSSMIRKGLFQAWSLRTLSSPEAERHASGSAAG